MNKSALSISWNKVKKKTVAAQLLMGLALWFVGSGSQRQSSTEGMLQGKGKDAVYAKLY